MNWTRSRAGIAALVGIITMLAAQPASAQTDVRAEIELMKKRIAELESALEKKESRELDRITDDVPAKSSSAPAPSGGTTLSSPTPSNSFIRNVVSNTTVGGYISSEFEDFENSPSAFDQHRLVLNVSSQLHKRLHFYSEIEYEHGPSISSEGSAAGNLNIVDADGDGVIDENDALYDKLYVWQEKNENGVVDEGEAMSLRQAGVRSINLGYENVRQDDGKGNLIGQIGGFTRTDGSQGTVADVWLQEKLDSAASTSHDSSSD